MRIVIVLALALVSLAGCANNLTYRYYSTYGIEGSRSDVGPVEAAKLHRNTTNSRLEQITAGQYDNPIRLVSTPQPVMPPRATEDRIEGDVRVRILFGESGKVENVYVDESPNQVLTDAVLAAVRRWEIEPATTNGKPVKVGGLQTFTFKAGW